MLIPPHKKTRVLPPTLLGPPLLRGLVCLEEDEDVRMTLEQELADVDFGEVDLQGLTALRREHPELTNVLVAVWLTAARRSYVDLSCCASLTELPAGLCTRGKLDLHYCTALTELPADLRVRGDVYLRGSGIPEGTTKPTGVRGEFGWS